MALYSWFDVVMQGYEGDQSGSDGIFFVTFDSDLGSFSIVALARCLMFVAIGAIKLGFRQFYDSTLLWRRPSMTTTWIFSKCLVQDSTSDPIRNKVLNEQESILCYTVLRSKVSDGEEIAVASLTRSFSSSRRAASTADFTSDWIMDLSFFLSIMMIKTSVLTIMMRSRYSLFPVVFTSQGISLNVNAEAFGSAALAAVFARGTILLASWIMIDWKLSL